VENGSITGLQHRITSASIMARWLPPAFKGGIDVDAVNGAAEVPYSATDMLVEYVRHETVSTCGCGKSHPIWHKAMNGLASQRRSTS
jgi:isoquinoline 1-oxidoreductase subunit beta